MRFDYNDYRDSNEASSAFEKAEKDHLFRYLMFIVAAILVVYVPVYGWLGAPFTSLCLFIGLTILTPLTFWVQKYKPDIARLFFIVCCNAYIFLASLGAGHQVSAELFCLPAMMLGLLLFDVKRVGIIGFTAAIALFDWFLIKWGSLIHLPTSLMPAALPFTFLSHLNFVAAFATTGSFLGLFVRSVNQHRKTSPATAYSARDNVEAVLLEKTLSEEKLKLVVESMQEGLIVHDASGRIVQANKAALEITGLTEDEIMGRTYVDNRWKSIALNGTELREEDLPARVVIRTGAPVQNFIMGIARPSGERRWIQVSGNPLTLPTRTDQPAGTVNAFALVTFTDITNMLAAQNEIHEFFRLAPDVMCVAGIDGKIRRVNPILGKILGYTDAELHAQSMDTWVHPDDAHIPYDAVRRMMETQKAQHFEIRMRTKSGAYRSLAWVGAGDEASATLYITARDRTEERAAQQVIQEKEAEKNRLGALLDEAQKIAHIGSWSYDPGTTKVTWSNQMYEIFARDPATGPQPAAEHIDRIHPEDQERWLAQTTLLYESSEVRKFRYRYVLDDRTVWVESIAQRRIDASGGIVTIAGTCQDITERVILENDLLAERAKMVNSAKMATLGEMSAGIAHEINNPLAIIIGKAEKLQRMANIPDMTVATMLNDFYDIKKTAHRIAAVIKGLRAFSRNSDDEPYYPTPLEPLLIDTLALCRERFKSRNVELFVSPIPAIEFDARATQVSHILLNLLSNAFDAVADSQDPWIKLDLAISGGDMIQFIVTDSGKGIPEDIATKIMNPFFTTKEVGKGTGLGLSISQGMAQDHNGTLWLDTASPNTRFILELPLEHK